MGNFIDLVECMKVYVHFERISLDRGNRTEERDSKEKELIA